MNIENIIFDFGNVLIDIDFDLTEKALAKLLDKTPKGLLEKSELTKTFHKFEKGLISPETFLWNLQQEQTIPTADPNILIDAWNALLLQLPEERLEYILRLRKKYKIYLLSNTNSIHIDWVHRYLEREYGIVDFEDRYFNKVYYSHQVHLRKPDEEIYTFVLDDLGIDARQALFIDDNLENIITAKKIGINTIHHDPHQNIIEVLDCYLTSIY